MLDSPEVAPVSFGRYGPVSVGVVSAGFDFTVLVCGAGVAFGCGNGKEGQLGTAPAPCSTCATSASR